MYYFRPGSTLQNKRNKAQIPDGSEGYLEELNSRVEKRERKSKQENYVLHMGGFQTHVCVILYSLLLLLFLTSSTIHAHSFLLLNSSQYLLILRSTDLWYYNKEPGSKMMILVSFYHKAHSARGNALYSCMLCV